jgi:hypothetical protein
MSRFKAPANRISCPKRLVGLPLTLEENMNNSSKWKLLRTLITLGFLCLGLAFVNSRAKVRADPADCMACDSAFTTCRSTCGSNETCYAECGDTYRNCLFSEPCSFPHPQPVQWQDDCTTRADKTRALCYRGVTSGVYLDCSTNGGTHDECCDAVWVDVFNGCL